MKISQVNILMNMPSKTLTTTTTTTTTHTGSATSFWVEQKVNFTITILKITIKFYDEQILTKGK